MHSYYNVVADEEQAQSLNPCFNGRCTRTDELFELKGGKRYRLNPCFNGRCTRTKIWKQLNYNEWEVLILVLMEDALVREDKQFNRKNYGVLILVLMEDALVLVSQMQRFGYNVVVLILVLMEDALVQKDEKVYC